MRAFSGVSLLLLLLSAAGCAKQVKAEFPRPPATAKLPPADEPEEPKPEPAPVEPVVEEPVESAAGEETVPTPRTAPPRREVPPLTEEEPLPEEPPSTTLAGSGEVDPELASKFERADALLLSVSQRSLTSLQADQLLAARGFVAQAKQALAEGDPRRALVLIDKGVILAEDVDRLSRP